MQNISYAVVILVYRNYNDLKECIESIINTIPDCRCIVVNAYYDEYSMEQIKSISIQNDCDFINIENKGYSYGNNVGIDYAKSHYNYKYVIISNPDILVKKFNVTTGSDILAPLILRKDGNPQNPMIYRYSGIVTLLEYYGLKWRIKLIVYLGIILNKIIRKWGVVKNKLFNTHVYPIYAAHGSFLLISREAVDVLKKVYDDNMFLFTEELVLAKKAKILNLSTMYTDEIEIFHKEDGSMKLGKISVFEEIRKSNIYYYNNYVKKNNI